MRLAISVALSVATVVGVVSLAAMRLAARQLEADLREAARITAVGVADDIELRQEPVTADMLLPMLGDFMNAAVDLSSISVFRSENGNAIPITSTSVIASVPPGLVEQTIMAGDPVWSDGVPHVAMIAVPIRRTESVTGAVVVAVSLRTVEQLRRTGGIIAIAGAAVAMAGLTLLIYFLDKATGELRDRNEQLVRSYESVLQLRETAGRAQQLAAVGQTLANVAHQIGTPLNLVSGHVQLLQQQIDDPATARRLTIVQQQIDRVTTAVRSLLDQARPPGERRPTSVAAMLERLGETMRARLSAAGVALEAHVGEDLPHVIADETQLELAILNLVTNAIDAMPDGGILTLTAARTPSGARIEVRDTGSGIPPDMLPKIFDPWVTTKPTGRGAGLGLSITRDVINRMGGAIGVESTPGRGTTFTIDVPAVEPLVHA